MNPSPELIKQLRREKIEAARQMSGEEKLRAGADLFAYACEITKAGIRAQFPDADEEEVLQLLRDRLELAVRREKGGSMEPLEIVGEMIDAPTRIEIPFMLVGSFSSNFYGTPRSTKDADFVVQLDSSKLNPLIALLKGDFKFNEQMTFETVTSTIRYRLVHRQSAFMVGLFELSPDPHDQARFRRRVAKPLAGRSAFLPTPEDVIVTKLRWSKGGNRQKDVEDVRDVIAVQAKTLDLTYIRQWVDQHGTRELFERLLQEESA